MTGAVSPDLIHLLAQRLALTQDETAALERGDYASLIAGRAATDPRLAPLLPLLAQADQPTARQPPDRRRERTRTDDRKWRRVRRHLRQLEDDLEAAVVVIAALARAFGACAACLGRDPSCERCDGDGGPGSAVPDRKQLLSWAEPALARLGLKATPIAPAHHAVANDDHTGDDDALHG